MHNGMLDCHHRYLFSLACFLLCAGCHTIKPTMQSEYIRPGLSQEWHALFDGAKQSIAESMTKKDKIPGLSIALVDREGVIWTAGFGYTDYDLKTPVTPDTIFSIQSMSKSFTTTLVLLAEQDGLVDLIATRPIDVLLTMGAGDIDRVVPALERHLNQRHEP